MDELWSRFYLVFFFLLLRTGLTLSVKKWASSVRRGSRSQRPSWERLCNVRVTSSSHLAPLSPSPSILPTPLPGDQSGGYRSLKGNYRIGTWSPVREGELSACLPAHLYRCVGIFGVVTAGTPARLPTRAPPKSPISVEVGVLGGVSYFHLFFRDLFVCYLFKFTENDVHMNRLW